MVSFIAVGKKLAPYFIGLVGKSLSFRDNLSSVKRRPTTGNTEESFRTIRAES
jgi:hypothetical protein